MKANEDIYCKCGSENLHFVKYEMKNKVKILRKQCFDCGYLLIKNYKRTLVSNFASLPEMDKTLRENNYNKKSNLYNCKIVFNNYRNKYFQRSKEYYRNVYLRSEEWKEKRNLIMQHYNDACQDCNNKATDVHHLHYDNIFCEKFEDLIPLCRSCHENRHNLKDNKRSFKKVSGLSIKSIKQKKEQEIKKALNLNIYNCHKCGEDFNSESNWIDLDCPKCGNDWEQFGFH